MKIHLLHLGELKSNCYIVETEPGRCVAVDIGGDSRILLSFLEMNRLTLSKILLTHGHFDHIGGVAEAADASGAEVYIHQADAAMLESEALSLASSMSIMPFKPVKKYISVSDGCYINDGSLSFRVLHTPGHSQGSVCYICEDTIFTGDTLFNCSIGRTDFPGSDAHAMLSSLQKLKNLEGDYRVCPGHFDETTLDYERNSNPYLSKLE